MRRFFNALLALGLVGAGGAAIAAVAWLQSDRFALTSLADSTRQVDQTVRVDRTAQTTQFVPKTHSLHQVPDLALTPRPSPATRLHRGERAPQPEALVPCSDWRDLGPAAVTREDGPERRHVRLLCPAGKSVTEHFGPDA